MDIEDVRILLETKKNLIKREHFMNLDCVLQFLQKVLNTPQGEASSFYYKRKFATYNLMIYDIGKKMGYCYVWNESEAKRGSNEIGTCLLKFIKHMTKKGVNEFRFYSDNCGGQNRNRFIFAM